MKLYLQNFFASIEDEKPYEMELKAAATEMGGCDRLPQEILPL
jgi:hypothetical protein